MAAAAKDPLSDRLRAVVDALPLRPGLRVLEVGGAPGAAARAVAARVAPSGHVVVLDRSPRGVALVASRCAPEIEAGLLSVVQDSVEDPGVLTVLGGAAPFDLAFACRVGALDGRHPQLHASALDNLRRALVPGGLLYLDTGDPLEAVRL